ncbi:hypothetical protein M1D72_05895 [Vibrio sp. AK197]
MAVLVCSDFCVYGAVQRHLYSVPHYLTGRYVFEGENLCSSYFLWKNRWLVGVVLIAACGTLMNYIIIT